ncbi:MAG: DUF86 domain-containing protein [Acidobacteria bacterium]|nr:DUF86 domain-containing protein [Acidobacteriota bacterium]
MGALGAIRAGGRAAFLADEGVQAQAERHVQLAVQSAIDVALHIVAEASAATPEEYGAGFIELGRLGIIAPDLAERLRAAAGLRNVLVHAYLDVDPARIWEHIEDVGDLRDFAAAIDAFVGT